MFSNVVQSVVLAVASFALGVFVGSYVFSAPAVTDTPAPVVEEVGPVDVAPVAPVEEAPASDTATTEAPVVVEEAEVPAPAGSEAAAAGGADAESEKK